MYLARRYRHTSSRCIAYIVIEDEYAANSQGIAEQAFDFRVVYALDLVRIIEIDHRGWRLNQREAVAIECELGLATARILDAHLARIVDTVPARHARRRLGAITRRFFRTALEIVKRRGQVLGSKGRIEWHDHTPPGLEISRFCLPPSTCPGYAVCRVHPAIAEKATIFF